jgi:hypothetical protein
MKSSLSISETKADDVTSLCRKPVFRSMEPALQCRSPTLSLHCTGHHASDENPLQPKEDGSNRKAHDH